MAYLIGKLMDLRKRSALARARRASQDQVLEAQSRPVTSRSSSPGALDPEQIDLEFQRALNMATAEAAQSALAKESKLHIAQQAVFVGQMAQIAQDEVESVRALKNKKVFDGQLPARTTARDDMNIIVCDDFNEKPEPPPPAQTQPAEPAKSSSSAMLPWLLVAGLTAGAAGLGAGYLLNRDDPQPTVVEKKVETPTGTTTTTVRGVGSTVELVQPK